MRVLLPARPLTMTGQLHKLGKLGYRDTGAVPGSTTYTTVVIVHGFGWSGGAW